MSQKESKITLIPLGGLGEIGNNMTVVKYGNSMIVIDCGMEFPEDDMLGIDTVIPDYTFLVENRKRIKGIFLTHGHEDHIGALPYVLKDLDVPVYGTKMTLGIVKHKLKEARVSGNLHEMSAGETVTVSPFKVEFIRVNHSIPDAIGMAIHTPIGVVFHTGDFKIDMTPVDGEVMDFHRIAALGQKGVLLMMADSTNAERPGYTKSEKLVGSTFNEAFRNAKGRIIVATFATNVHRLQQAISTAAKYNRKVAIVGRSMINVVSIATELGYLKIPKNTIVDIDEIDHLAPNKVAILATGSQGEPMSTLTRIANGEHKNIKLIPGDTIIVSAHPIPGNEVSVGRNIDLLVKQGADVVADADSDIHVSGHARQEELKLVLAMVKPKYFVPVHGEERMLFKHASLAQLIGVPSDNIFILENGSMLEVTKKDAGVKGAIPVGKVMIDGMGDKDVGSIVLRDRRQLANDGIMVVIVTVDKHGMLVAKPEMISRGFIYVKEAEELMEAARDKISSLMEKYEGKRIKDFSAVKQDVKECVGKVLYADVKRKPMIIPIIIELD
ncbi:MAG TPA: ribonuclease J [Clostridiales bacterium]|nr:ribonuclease J [Clostridiales bacterium]